MADPSSLLVPFPNGEEFALFHNRLRTVDQLYQEFLEQPRVLEAKQRIEQNDPSYQGREILHVIKAVNIYGIVKEYHPPKKTAGTDLRSAIVFFDPSAGINNPVELFCFHSRDQPWKGLRAQCVGDIVRFTAIDFQLYVHVDRALRIQARWVYSKSKMIYFAMSMLPSKIPGLTAMEHVDEDGNSRSRFPLDWVGFVEPPNHVQFWHPSLEPFHIRNMHNIAQKALANISRDSLIPRYREFIRDVYERLSHYLRTGMKPITLVAMILDAMVNADGSVYLRLWDGTTFPCKSNLPGNATTHSTLVLRLSKDDVLRQRALLGTLVDASNQIHSAQEGRNPLSELLEHQEYSCKHPVKLPHFAIIQDCTIGCDSANESCCGLFASLHDLGGKTSRSIMFIPTSAKEIESLVHDWKGSFVNSFEPFNRQWLVGCSMDDVENDISPLEVVQKRQASVVHFADSAISVEALLQTPRKSPCLPFVALETLRKREYTCMTACKVRGQCRTVLSPLQLEDACRYECDQCGLPFRAGDAATACSRGRSNHLFLRKFSMMLLLQDHASFLAVHLRSPFAEEFFGNTPAADLKDPKANHILATIKSKLEMLVHPQSWIECSLIAYPYQGKQVYEIFQSRLTY